MALAISFKSESSDHYVFAFDDFPSTLEVTNKITERLGSEVAYLYIMAIDSNHTDMAKYNRNMSDAVNNYIDSMRDAND